LTGLVENVTTPRNVFIINILNFLA
jgi:hypothetical protein